MNEVIYGYADKGGSLERRSPENVLKRAIADFNQKADGRATQIQIVSGDEFGLSVIGIAEDKEKVTRGGKK